LKWISLGIPCFPFLIDSFLSSSGWFLYRVLEKLSEK
jgi:hypothetical protein